MRSLGMKHWWWMAAITTTIGSAQPAPRPIDARVIRFYSPADSTTLFEVVTEVPYAALFARMTTARYYRLDGIVQDVQGHTLDSFALSRTARFAGALTTASAIESFGFRAPPAEYLITIRATPVGGVPLEARWRVEALAPVPTHSDLLLATAVREVVSDSNDGAPGEVLRAGTAMRTTPRPTLRQDSALLSFYMELYRGPRSGVVERRAEVLAATGPALVRSPAERLDVPQSGGVTRGAMDLTGLPEGEYRLRVTLTSADTVLTVEAPFAVAPWVAPAHAAHVAARRVEDALVADADSMTLDSLYAPLTHILEPDERGVFPNLTVDGRRRFIAAFWRRRDPSPATPDNPVMAAFYDGVTFANVEFREGGAGGIPGWRTDRGRVYLRHGRPDETYRRPGASPRPFEVWRYTRGRPRTYVFYDQSALGNYYLLATNDPTDQGTRPWEQFVRQPAPMISPGEVRQLFAFLGIPLSPVDIDP